MCDVAVGLQNYSQMKKEQEQREQILFEKCKPLRLCMYVCEIDMKPRKSSSIQNLLREIGFLKLTSKEFSL